MNGQQSGHTMGVYGGIGALQQSAAAPPRSLGYMERIAGIRTGLGIFSDGWMVSPIVFPVALRLPAITSRRRNCPILAACLTRPKHRFGARAK